MKKRHIIINADDFGIDKNRTIAILECFRLGAITQTTAMVNMPYYETAVSMAKSAGLINRMGLHINLTEGAPLTESIRNSTFFCNSNGEFTVDWQKARINRVIIPNHVAELARQEICAQIEKFLDSGGSFMHVDSHHHVHTDWSIVQVLVPLLKKYGFTSVRKSRNFGRGLTFVKRLYKGSYNRILSRDFHTSDLFGSFDDLVFAWRQVPANATVEIMVHPMLGSPENLDAGASITDSGTPIGKEINFYEKLKTIEFYD